MSFLKNLFPPKRESNAVKDKTLIISFAQSKSKSYEDALAIAKTINTFSQTLNDKGVQINTVRLPINAASLGALLDVMSPLKRLKNVTLAVGTESNVLQDTVKAVFDTLSCFRYHNHPQEIQCQCADEYGIGCKFAFNPDPFIYWFSFGTYSDEWELGKLTWNFDKEAIKNYLIRRYSLPAAVCPAWGNKSPEAELEKIPEKILITENNGLPQLFDKLGVKHHKYDICTEDEYVFIKGSESERCPMTLQWIGKTYSRSGKDKRYLPLRLAINGGAFAPVVCKSYLVPEYLK